MIAPKDQAIRFALARALLSAGRSADAESNFREAIALGTAAESAKAGDAATNAPSGARSGAPLERNTAAAKLGLAEALLQGKKTAEAIDAFAAYLAVVPNDRAARFEPRWRCTI